MENKLFHLFITSFLWILGKSCPDFVCKIIDKICIMPLHRNIIKARYIHHMKFENIADFVGYYTSVRNIYKIHKKFIDNLVNYVITNKE